MRVLVLLIAAALQADDGLRLLGELGCGNCHDLPGARPGPILKGAGSRLTLRATVDSITGATGSAMPRFPALTQKSVQTLADLIASSKMTLRDTPSGAAERGQQHYERIGCAACHGSTAPHTARLLPGALTAFLLDPLATHPSALMPRLPLDPQAAADLEAYLARPSAVTDQPGPADPQARKLFSSTGCANCHAFGEAPLPKRPIKDIEAGCLDTTSRKTPQYKLDAAQRTAIQATLRNLAAGKTPTAAETLDARLTTLGCYNCHARNGKGGPSPANDKAFTVIEDTDLGDEGRLPPPLTAAGYKLTPKALHDAIRGRTQVHPAMAVRMPDYGPAVAEELAALFTAADMPAGLQPMEQTGRNAFGRELAGIKGLGCINCHNLRGRKSLGIGASDLALAPPRLRVEWFRDFLIDPARFHPATRMPSFWSGGKASNKTVLRGDTTRQIDSLWVYLMEIDQTRLPDGLEEKGTYEQKPDTEAIVLRAFMKDAGTHAVAVGFPGQLNAAFDSHEVRWALVWRGRFVDAESVWEDRFNPPMSPLGTDVLKLPDGSDCSGPVRFRGYRLGAQGIPSFLYDCGEARITDTLAPSAGGGLVRTVNIEAKQPLTFRLSPEETVRIEPGRHTFRKEFTW